MAPTATEAFNLRIKCKQMADQKADDQSWHELSVEGGALLGMNAAAVAKLNDQNRPEVIGAWSSSRYDARNNRCYIEVYSHTRSGSMDKEYRQVFDEIDNLLAHTQIINGVKSGTVWDENYRGERYGPNSGWDIAIAYMDNIMSDSLQALRR